MNCERLPGLTWAHREMKRDKQHECCWWMQSWAMNCLALRCDFSHFIGNFIWEWNGFLCTVLIDEKRWQLKSNIAIYCPQYLTLVASKSNWIFILKTGFWFQLIIIRHLLYTGGAQYKTNYFSELSIYTLRCSVMTK